MQEPAGDALARSFANSLGRPASLARAPGRVNLIGEHTDYNGLPVLPCAIPREIRMAFAPSDGAACVLRHASARFPPVRFDASPRIVPDPPGAWGNYPKAAVSYLADLLAREGLSTPRGFNALVTGDIPQAGGLSSSSALVVAAALAFLHANGRAMAPETLAAHMADAERYVGTRGGGMDQAASLLARAGHALRIDFFPLRAEPVPFPEGYAVLACHSLVRAAKSADARRHFNLRVAECRAAAMLLRQLLAWPQGERLGDFAREFGARACLETLESAGCGPAPLEPERLARLLDMNPDALRAALGTDEPLRIVTRARHVLEEGTRVDQATAALRRGDVAALGRLLDSAHASARDDFEISCPELEELCAIGRGEGVLGARLTGAGFGGFAVMLGRTADLHAVRDAVDRRFYAARTPAQALDDLRFIFTPAAGAGVWCP